MISQRLFFSDKKTKESSGKYMIEQMFHYLVMTDTDSICVLFIFIYRPESNLPDGKFIDVLFEKRNKRKVIKENEILH